MKPGSLLVAAACVLMPATPGNTAVDTTLPTNGKFVEIISPNGGEVFHVGDTMHIRWHADDTAMENAAGYLMISFDGGIVFPFAFGQYILSPGAEKWENYYWVVGDTSDLSASGDPMPSESDSCLVMFRDENREPAEGTDISDQMFRIVGPDTTLPTNGKLVEIISPNGGEVFHVGDTMHIRWNAVDSAMTANLLSITFDYGLTWNRFDNCGHILPEDSCWEDYVWIVGDTSVIILNSPIPSQSGSCLVRFQEVWGEYEDMSDATFSIAAADAGAKGRSVQRGPVFISATFSNSSVLQISSSLNRPCDIQLYDMKGDRLWQGKHVYGRRCRIDVPLSRGMYVVRIGTHETRIQLRVPNFR